MAGTHRHEELNDAVQYFDVLVLQPAAQHCGQLWVLLFLPLRGRKAVGLTPRPVVLPPRAVGRHPQGKYITVLEWEWRSFQLSSSLRCFCFIMVKLLVLKKETFQNLNCKKEYFNLDSSLC